jgi:hypothetical protein
LLQHSDSIVLRLLQISTLTPRISIQQPVLAGSEFAGPPLSDHCQDHLARLNLFFVSGFTNTYPRSFSARNGTARQSP